MEQASQAVREITPRSKDFAQWYSDVILKAEMADYAPVRGCMVIRPYGFAIWENIQAELDARIKATGHVNAYFPLFIPESLLLKEAEHVEGFAPEVAWVTMGGKEELAERLAIRPTSETVICSMYSKWIKSWRDLPVLINQWCSVVRWEKTTRPFLRTSEFLWQEGHTAHATEAEAEDETRRMLGVYVDLVENVLAIPVVAGRKSEREKFAGALRTYSLEAMMSDGRALQAGTSHNLGQNFARVFNIAYLDRANELQFAWQTSWGVSTRLIGALVMVHGDDRGLALPPRVAPTQVIVVPIMPPSHRAAVVAKATEICGRLKDIGVRSQMDARDEFTPGWKFNEWEMRGVPVRLEIGPKDLQAQSVVLVRRDTGAKVSVPEADITTRVPDLLDDVQATMFEQARRFLEDNTFEVETYPEMADVFNTKKGFVRAAWCGGDRCEEQIKEETGATIRVVPLPRTEWESPSGGSPPESTSAGQAAATALDPARTDGRRCVCCGSPACSLAVFGKAY